MFHPVHGKRLFDDPNDFIEADDGEWVDTPAKINAKPKKAVPPSAPTPANTEDDESIPPDPDGDIELLIERAKELGIRGNVRGMKRETLVAKITEAEEAD